MEQWEIAAAQREDHGPRVCPSENCQSPKRRWRAAEGDPAVDAASSTEQQTEVAASADVPEDKSSDRWASKNAAELKRMADAAREMRSGDGEATTWLDARDPVHLGSRFSSSVIMILGRPVVVPWERSAVTFHYGARFLKVSCLPGLCSPDALGLACGLQLR